MRFVLFCLLLSWGCIPGWGQETKKDSVIQSRDSVVRATESDSVFIKRGKKKISVEAYTKRFDPRKALFFSAILPGAGQAYNKKYWKIPLVYGGLISLVAVMKYYNDGEDRYKQQLFYNINHPGITYNPISGATTANLRTVVNFAQRQRDYFAILTGMFYILQIVDAHVDAHLKEFDINPNMHVRIEPSMLPTGTAGLGITLLF
ncbi:MAG: hypothetical protein JST43_05555 [Bacteroidetes bacterium]|nr:hypothetical protein [Bacteroidota bacterium]MBS1539257.1 hypothetical protein [Bacteroidota bacterium]